MIKRRFSMKLKMFIVFTCMMILSTLFSFMIMQNIGKRFVKHEIYENQQGMARTLLNIKEEANLPFETVMSLVDNPAYEFYYFTETELTSQQNLLFKGIEEEERVALINTLQSQEESFITITPKRAFLPLTYLKSDGEYILIYMNEQTIVKAFVQRPIKNALMITAGIGLLLMFLGAKQVAKPVSKLSNGLLQVANGNFDIELPVRGHDEIALMAIQFNKMVHELRNNVYLRRDFMNNICHELKTPLASIQGFAKLLQYEDISPQQRLDYTQIIGEEAERLSKLTVNILNLSKLENQSLLEEVEVFNLAEEVRKVFLMLEPLWSEKELQFDLELEEVEIAGCKELIVQVILNLLSNAIKFSKPGGELTVLLTSGGHELQLEIEDKGCGMNQETQERLFEAFYQGDTTHNEAGHGLGLSIVKRIVTLHQGTITVESEVGVGSKLVVVLPIKQ